MFGRKKKDTVKLRQHEMLQKRYDKLKREFDEQAAKMKAMENKLEMANAKLEYVEKAEVNYAEAIYSVRHVREQYEIALNDLNVIRNKYRDEMMKLIKEMK